MRLRKGLIPLSSGLVFRRTKAVRQSISPSLNPFIFRAGVQAFVDKNYEITQGLNPFIFRAGVQAHAITVLDLTGEVLIPLSSGLVFRLGTNQAAGFLMSLNPFIFRAGVQALFYHDYGLVSGLNPFIFRAGVQAKPTR